MKLPEYEHLFQRNLGILSAEDQHKVRNSTVAIAGCGGDGGSPAVSLARLGISNFKLADPDTFDVSNNNRQEGAYCSTTGRNKAETIARIILDINPSAQVQVFNEGITDANISTFLHGSDLLLEEVDFRLPHITVALHQASRQQFIPIITVVSVAWNAFLFHFAPDSMPFEEFIELKKDLTQANDFFATANLLALVPEIPDYIDPEILDKIMKEEIEIPVVAPAVNLAAALASAFCIYKITNSKNIMPAPYYYSAGDLLLKAASIK